MMSRKLSAEERISKHAVLVNYPQNVIARLDAITEKVGCTRTDLIIALASGDFCLKSCDKHKGDYPYCDIKFAGPCEPL
jgi:hypothetical protein